MENFTALYVYADNITLTITFPAAGMAIYELFKTASGAQTFYTQVLYPNKRGEVQVTFNSGVYGWHADPAVTITVSTDPNVTVATRLKPNKDPWPTPPPPPPPTKFASLSSTKWNLHYKSLSLRQNEFMFTLGGGAPEPEAEADDDLPAPPRGALTMAAVHVAATRRGPGYGAAIAAGELTFPTDLMAIGHRLTHLRGAEHTRFLLGETATRDNLIDAVLAASQRLTADGVFVLSFAGHGGQMPDLSYDEVDGTDEIWQLYDAFLYDDELGYLLAHFPPRSHCVVIADCCNGGGMIDVAAEREEIATGWGGLNAPMARRILPRVEPGLAPHGVRAPRRRVPTASVALIAATSELQGKVNTPTTQFGRVVEAVLGSGKAPTYRDLAAQLKLETPTSEQATVWCSNEQTWDLAPLGR